MDKKLLAESNHLIGHYMDKNFIDPLNHMYDKDWNQLMPVWKKVGGEMYDCIGGMEKEKYLEAFSITKMVLEGLQKVDIEKVYKYVVSAIIFIKSFKQLTNGNNT